jgi:hypothetical protein
MYTLCSGGFHPLYIKEKDNADQYKEKLKNPIWEFPE